MTPSRYVNLYSLHTHTAPKLHGSSLWHVRQACVHKTDYLYYRPILSTMLTVYMMEYCVRSQHNGSVARALQQLAHLMDTTSESDVSLPRDTVAAALLL